MMTNQGEGGGSASSSAAITDSPKTRSRASTLAQLRNFISSDDAYELLQVAKLFVAAYSPYLAPLLVLSLSCAYTPESFLTWTPGMLFKMGMLSLGQIITLASCTVLFMVVALLLLGARPQVYLVDFASFKSLDEYKMSTDFCINITVASKKYSMKNMLFQLKVLLKSGLGDETYGPPFLLKNKQRRHEHIVEEDASGAVQSMLEWEEEVRLHPTHEEAVEETQLMMFGALDELLFKTGIDSSCIDILIVNVSMFYPSPSLSSHLVNRYKMRPDVKTYNLSGMGCAAGNVALDMAAKMLSLPHNKNKCCVLVGTENIGLNWYDGNDKSMLVPNCLFRCGSYALLLSNKRVHRRCAKFQLLQSVRATTAASDKSYNVIFTQEDDAGIVGTSLSVQLLDVASRAVAMNMVNLVPRFMPFSEILKLGLNYVQRNVLKMKYVKPYVPNFRKAFTHFCLHPGGKAVIQGIGKSLNLSDYDMEPAKMTLHRFGNTSSCGLWYAMAYCEAKHRLKKGDTVWQLALGSGFKCNSVVWKVLRDVRPTAGCNPWLDCIDDYPVQLPETIDPSHKYYKFMKYLEEQAKLEEENRELPHAVSN